MNSIFTNPYKYRQSENRNELENYLTEIFAGVLRKDGGLFSKFCQFINCRYDKSEDNIIIRTQYSYKINDKILRPDIRIDIGEHSIVLIENKVDSFERTDQLNDYCQVLEDQRTYPNKFLIYIAKFFEAKSIRNS